jgi:hypothetical protein
MQPYFFPYLGYFQLIEATDRMILHDHLHYINGGWIDRNTILLRRGGPFRINVPLKKKSSNRKIAQTEIDTSSGWEKRVLKIIRLNYTHSPFFHEIYPTLEALLHQRHTTIAELNFAAIRAVCNLLGMGRGVVYGGARYLDIEDTIAIEPSPHYDRKTQRIIAICKREGADTYTNPIGGRALYSKERFAESGIHLQFIQTLPYCYPQRTPVFYPNLSILDTLFHCGVNHTKKLLSNFTFT